MQDTRPEGGEDQTASGVAWPSPHDALLIFTAGWLGGSGLLAALNPIVDPATRLLALAEAVAAGMWFFPRLRMGGFGAMLAVLAIAMARGLMYGHAPGATLFYAVVVGYLAVIARVSGRDG